MDIHIVWWAWIIVSAIFLFVELMTVTFFGLWMAIAAIVPAVISFLFPDVSLSWQITAWIISMLICAYGWIKIHKRMNPPQTEEDSVIGQIGILSRDSSATSAGNLILQKPVEGRTEWKCFSAENIPVHTRVIVTDRIEKGLVRVKIHKQSVS